MQGILSISFLGVWVFLELRTVRFLFFLFASIKNIIIKERIKLFLVQALSGLLILILIVQKEFLNHELLVFLVALVILFKIRAAPFHG